MSFSRAFQWYHSHLDPIWPDGTFKLYMNKYFFELPLIYYFYVSLPKYTDYCTYWTVLRIKKIFYADRDLDRDPQQRSYNVTLF